MDHSSVNGQRRLGRATCVCLAALLTGFATGPLRAAAAVARSLSLDECLALALQNNQRRPASRFAVATAEAQHQQALASYWPQVHLTAGYQRRDEPPNFVFPASGFQSSSQSVTTPSSVAFVTVPAGVLGPTAVQLPVSVPTQTIGIAPQRFAIPEQDVKLLDRDTVSGTVELKWLLFDGGLRHGLRQQTENQIAAMKEEARRTDLEITDSVHRLYHGAVLARQLRQLGADTLARMEATLGLTETMYKGGGGKVTKTDFLDNTIMVETIRALTAQLEKNEALAQAALANTAGLPWDATIAPSAAELPFAPFAGELDALVGAAYRFNPDWNKLEAGLRAAEGAIVAARSGHFPKLGLTGDLQRWGNDYNAGLATARNKSAWSVGVGLELPLFQGGLTRAKVAEMRARLGQLKAQGVLLKDGLGLQIKVVFLGLAAAQKSQQATLAAMKAAGENRELTTRAYQSELVETEKVIRAQLMEALMTAQHLKTRYDFLALQSQLSLVVGRELTRSLAPPP